MESLDQWIEDHAAERGAHPAVVFETESTGYADLHARVLACAAGLREEGVREGDRVAFCGLNRVEQLEALFACARLGAILVPLNNRLSRGELASQLAHADPALALATDGFGPELAAAAPGLRVRDLDAVPFQAVAPGAAPARAGRLTSPLLMVFTSGTTGVPKGAVHTQSALRHTVENGVAHQGLGAGDRILTVLPLFHVGGLNIQTLPALAVGATVLLHRRFDPTAALEAIARDRPTQALLVPATMQALLEHPAFEATDVSCLRGLNTGSSVVPAHLIHGFLERGVPVGQVYGATETGPTAVVLDYADGAAHVGSCGRPARHTRLRIVGKDGREAGPGEVGELQLSGPNLFTEYWENPEATAAAFVDGGWYRTGDTGSRDEAGYVHIADRLRDMVISGGENVFPAEVENVLGEHPEIREIAVLGRPDERWGEAVVAVVTLAPDSALDLDALRDWARDRLARYKHPRELIVLDELPRTALGKVKKHVLREKLGIPTAGSGEAESWRRGRPAGSRPT